MTAKLKPMSMEIQPDEAIDWKTAPSTEQEQILRIRRLGKRISEYISYMCKSGVAQNSSPECKEKTLSLFYDHLVIVEHQLSRIHDLLRLG